jgi:hypothetical protein
MTPASSKRQRRAAAALAFAATLAGCGPSPAGLDADTARELQSTVAEVRQAAGGGDFATALTTLDRLSADVERSAGEGRIGTERRTRIAEAIALVRADVQAQLAAAEPPAVPATPTQPRLPEQKPEEDKPDEKKDGEGKDGGKGRGRN